MASAVATTADEKKSKAVVRVPVPNESAQFDTAVGASAGLPLFLEAGLNRQVTQAPTIGAESGAVSGKTDAGPSSAAPDDQAAARGLVLIEGRARQADEKVDTHSTADAAKEARPAAPAAAGAKPVAAQGGPKGAVQEAMPADGKVAVAKAPKSPHEDPGFLAVVARVKSVAERQGHNNPAQIKAAQAQAAASGPANDVASQAAAAQVAKMGAQEPKPFDKKAFKAALLKKISEVAPTNLKEANEFKESGKAAEIKGSVTSQVTESKDVAQGPIKQTSVEAPNTAGLQPKPVTPLPPTNIGPPPPSVGAADAAPKPKSDSEISLDASSHSLDEQMASGGVSQDQLEKSNEPEFKGALKDKEQAQEEAQTAPAEYRKTEQTLLGGAKAEAAGATVPKLLAMHGVRGRAFGKIGGHQLATKSADEQARAGVAQHVEEIYQATKLKVEARLKQLDDQTNQTFDQGAEQARAGFESYVGVHFSHWKYERYDNRLGGSLLWAKDKLFGLPDDVNDIYTAARDLYVQHMDGVIDQVAAIVETGLTEAKGLITAGLDEVKTYVKDLPDNLRQVGEEAVGKIQDSFDGLRQSVDDKRDQLIDGLAKKYVENLKQVDARIDEMKEENKGLVSKAAGAIAGVINTIRNLKNLLLNVLARAAAAIGLIIKDPIGFLGNMVSAVKLGLQNFIGNIGAHMKQGFMEWLFGAVAEAGIQLPKTFDLKGILSLVMQVLGLTWTAIRARAVAILGEKVVSAIETTVDIIKRVITEGPGALWDWLKEKVGDLKAMVLDQLQDFIVTRVIMAGITWLVGLLNPASAFIKACKAIYDIIMFFVERGSQILALVNAVIDSITAIAQGALGGAAAMVENALAKGIPVVIGFLASLLGLGGISDKIKSVIETIRKPIGEAIDWVIHKAVSLAKTVGGLLGFGKGKDDKPDDRTQEKKKEDLHKAVQEGNQLLKDDKLSNKEVGQQLSKIKSAYRIPSLEIVTASKNGKRETDYVKGEINPIEEGERITRDLTEDSGMVVEITSYLGAPKARKGYEKDFPTTSAFAPGVEAPSQRAHSGAPGLGRESAAGIRRAPTFVNQELQNRGIEKFLRGLFQKVKNDPNMKFPLKTETRSFNLTTRLESIQYQLEAEIEGKTRVVLVATIVVGGRRTAPTTTCSIDYVGAEFAGFLVSAAEDIFATRLDELDE
jgi:hypothetical protein